MGQNLVDLIPGLGTGPALTNGINAVGSGIGNYVNALGQNINRPLNNLGNQLNQNLNQNQNAAQQGGNSKGLRKQYRARFWAKTRAIGPLL